MLYYNKNFCNLLKLSYIPLEKICLNKFRLRQAFDNNDFKRLLLSIKHIGLIHPLTVRKLCTGMYELIDGEQRLNAATALGIKRVPCIILTSRQNLFALYSLVVNVEQKRLCAFDEADSILELMNALDLSHIEIAEFLGISVLSLMNKLKLLNLSPAQRRRAIDARLSEGHINEVAGLPDSLRDDVLDIIIAKQLTVLETQSLINQRLARANGSSDKKKSATSRPSRTSAVKDIRIFINSLTKIVNAMKAAGFDADANCFDGEGELEYKITVKKSVGESAAAVGVQLRLEPN